jgi:glucokinase
VQCAHLPLEGVSLRDKLEQRTGLRVSIDNGAAMAVRAEHATGAARGCQHVVLLTIGTGVGEGLILNGRPYAGRTASGGELGHMVIDQDGPRCWGRCPSTVCLGSGGVRERYSARRPCGDGTGAWLFTRRRGQQRSGGQPCGRGRRACRRPFRGQPARARRTRARRRIAALENIFSPNIVVVGGGVMAAGELLLAPARAEAARRALAPMSAAWVVAAAHGRLAGVLGAGLVGCGVA